MMGWRRAVRWETGEFKQLYFKVGQESFFPQEKGNITHIHTCPSGKDQCTPIQIGAWWENPLNKHTALSAKLSIDKHQRTGVTTAISRVANQCSQADIPVPISSCVLTGSLHVSVQQFNKLRPPAPPSASHLLSSLYLTHIHAARKTHQTDAANIWWIFDEATIRFQEVGWKEVSIPTSSSYQKGALQSKLCTGLWKQRTELLKQLMCFACMHARSECTIMRGFHAVSPQTVGH